MASPKSLCSVTKIILGCMIIGIAFGLSLATQEMPFKTSLKNLCEMTLYPTTCYNSLEPSIASKTDLYDSLFFYNLSIQTSITEVSRASKDFSENGTLTRKLDDMGDTKNLMLQLESCRLHLSLASYHLNLSLPTIRTNLKKHETRSDFRTWLSASATNLQACIDSFEYASNEVRKNVNKNMDNSIKLATNSLSIIAKIDDHYTGSNDHDSDRKVLGDKEPAAWLSYEDRAVLFDSNRKITEVDTVVAADGSGNYETITEALRVVPDNSNNQFVIYVKEGIYNEIVQVDQSKWNVVMFGDGMDKTIVSGNLNSASGRPSYSTATFATYGKGFIARDMGFRNTAGPGNGQAVALLSGSDQSLFYKCMIDGYQDSLCTFSNRQFYRDCKIYGTVDFIYGDAAVVIQHSSILVKKPLPIQKNVITAQGKFLADSNSGISIQNCNIDAAEDLTGVQTFLGRPWKDFSTTIFMENQLGSLIDPQGWLPWENNITPPDTIYYAEYNNKGPGAETTNRVQWNGVRVDITTAEASKFTVKSLVNGDQWLPSTGVPVQLEL